MYDYYCMRIQFALHNKYYRNSKYCTCISIYVYTFPALSMAIHATDQSTYAHTEGNAFYGTKNSSSNGDKTTQHTFAE